MLLQTYPAICLAELGLLKPQKSLFSQLLNEVRTVTDFISQRYPWLTISDIPDRDRAIYQNEPVSAEGLFGPSFEAIQLKFEFE